MKHETTGSGATTPDIARPPRCICCDGIIEISPDQDIALGLNLALGLVSDECALICDGCASRLIAARAADEPPARGRR
jgi:hypothetical protein